MHNFYYCIVKLFKGIFKKEHKSNVHLFITPAPNNQLFVFVLLGYSTTLDKLVVSLQWKHEIGLIDNVIDSLKGHYEDKVEVMDKLNSTLKGDVYKFSINPKSDGLYIKSPIQFKMLTEYSTSKNILYTIDGDVKLKKPQKISDKQLRMVDKTITSKVKSLFKRLVS